MDANRDAAFAIAVQQLVKCLCQIFQANGVSGDAVKMPGFPLVGQS